MGILCSLNLMVWGNYHFRGLKIDQMHGVIELLLLTTEWAGHIIYIITLDNKRGDALSYSSEILRGNTDTIILGILKIKDSYGYEIMKNIIERGHGLVDIKDATIYTAFKRMEKEELITSYWGDEDDGARRKYYSITPKGQELYMQKVEEWREISIVLNDLIGGDL